MEFSDFEWHHAAWVSLRPDLHWAVTSRRHDSAREISWQKKHDQIKSYGCDDVIHHLFFVRFLENDEGNVTLVKYAADLALRVEEAETSNSPPPVYVEGNTSIHRESNHVATKHDLHRGTAR